MCFKLDSTALTRDCQHIKQQWFDGQETGPQYVSKANRVRGGK
jgi:hypothetical protein